MTGAQEPSRPFCSLCAGHATAGPASDPCLLCDACREMERGQILLLMYLRAIDHALITLVRRLPASDPTE